MTDTTRSEHFVLPGQVVVCTERCTFTTVLGSCVAVCLQDPLSGVGGMNHFVLPTSWQGQKTPHYGDVAMRELLGQVEALSGDRNRIQARVFGGACLSGPPPPDGKPHLGEQNVAFARRFLAEARIPILSEDVGGTRARKLKVANQGGATSVMEI